MAKKVVKKGTAARKKTVSKPAPKTAAKKAVKKPAVKAKAGRSPSASTAKKPVAKPGVAPAVRVDSKPNRLPVRRVIGRPVKEGIAHVEKPLPPSQVSAEAIRPAAVPTSPAPTSKVGWDAIPKGVPAHIKFLMKGIAAECSSAAAWPFPMGEFLATVPAQICAHEFACLLLSLEHDSGRIGELCGIPEDRAAILVESGTSHIQEYFAAVCPDIDRKWRAHIRGPGVGIEAIVDQHLVAKVDRDMQLVIGQLILATLGRNTSRE